ncbi:MAG: right-handed parallel beta-helix repeat-containing protein [Paraclostridium sp.]
MALDKNDGTFKPIIDGIVSGKTSQVTGVNEILNNLIGNDNYLKNKKLDNGNYVGTAEDLNNDIKGRLPYVNTIEDLTKQTKYVIGDIVEVLGYYTKGDGGGHPRQKKPTGYTGVDAVIGADGSIWGIVHSGEVSVSWFGAKGNESVDNSKYIQNCIDFTSLSSADAISFSNMLYKCDRRIVLKSDLKLMDGGLVAGDINGFQISSHMPFVYAEEQNNIIVENMSIDISAWLALPVGASSLRALLFRRGDNIEIRNNKFKSTGGAVAFIGCKNVNVTENFAESIKPNDSDNVHADGVIDVWTEYDIDATNTTITENLIKGNGFSRWGIMATGTKFEAQIMDVISLVVSDNVINGCFYDGIWVFGRNASLDGATITGNVIRNTRVGISVSDATGFTVVGNSITNTRGEGIHLWNETGSGGTLGCVGGCVSSNVLCDVASVGESVAIWVDGNSRRNTIVGNTIKGSTHYYGIATSDRSENNIISTNNVEKGRLGNRFTIYGSNLVEGVLYQSLIVGGQNTQDALLLSANYTYEGDLIKVDFSLNVTPASQGVLTEFTLTLPYGVTLSETSLYGSGVSSSLDSVYITADATKEKALVRFLPKTNTEVKINGSFVYKI